MIKINKSPVLTTSHYGTNYFFADDELLNIKTEHKTNLKVRHNQKVCDIDQISNDKSKSKKSYFDGIEFSKLDVLPENNLSKEVNYFVGKSTNFAENIIITKDIFLPIIFEFQPKQNLVDTLVLTVENNVNAKLIFRYISNETISHFLTLKILLKEGASLDFAEFFNLSKANNYISIEVVCETKSQFNCFVFDSTVNQSVQNIKIAQKGDEAVSSVNSVYLGGEDARLSQNYLVEVFGKKCLAKIKANGVLNNYAQKNFVGTIDFKQGSQKSIGEEAEVCTLLSKTAKSKSSPILLCGEEDVDGRHSSLVGSVDDGQLLYAMSRGITESEAKSLLIRAKLSKQISEIFDEDLKGQVFSLLDEFVK